MATTAWFTRVPRATMVESLRASDPAGTMFSPARTGRWTFTEVPLRSAYSTITTASAPVGTGAPVMISAASSGPKLDRTLLGGGSGFDLPDAAQARRRCGNIGGAHRIAIARGAGERREIAVGAQVFGEDKSESVEQRKHFGLSGRKRGSILLNGFSRFSKGQKLGFGTHDLTGFYRRARG